MLVRMAWNLVAITGSKLRISAMISSPSLAIVWKSPAGSAMSWTMSRTPSRNSCFVIGVCGLSVKGIVNLLASIPYPAQGALERLDGALHFAEEADGAALGAAAPVVVMVTVQ